MDCKPIGPPVIGASSVCTITCLKNSSEAKVNTSSLTGLSGAFYAYYFGSITPKVLSFELLVTIIFMIVIGGPHSFYGPLLGAALLTFVNEYMKGIFLGVTAHLRVITMGLLIILILRAYPGGLVGVAESVVNKLRRSINTLKKE
jgi:branched-chain amino acid transport system permease protein